jgi:hypothetical protein
LWVIFALLDPDPDPDPLTRLNPDPQPCKKGKINGKSSLEVVRLLLEPEGPFYRLKKKLKAFLSDF